MSKVSLEIDIVTNKDSFFLFEKSGNYHNPDNLTGWGLHTNKRLEIHSSEVRVTLPKASAFKSVDLTGIIPNENCQGIEINALDLGVDKLIPGVYHFNLVLNGNNGLEYILSQSCYVFYYKPLECCIEEKKAKLSPSDIDSDEFKSVHELELMLENAKHAACSGDFDSLYEIVDYISLQCKCCSNC